MNLQEYTQLAIRTESTIDAIKVDRNRITDLLSTIIAAGNLLDVIKKDTFYGIPTNVEKLVQRSEKIELNERILGYSSTNVDRRRHDEPQLEQIDSVDPRLAHAIIGIATEAVELLEALQESILNNKPIDIVNVGEEISDIMWYSAIATDAGNIDWDGLLVANIAKLKARYPAKFDAEAAHERDLETERNVLETHIQQT